MPHTTATTAVQPVYFDMKHVLQKAAEYFGGDEFAADIWTEKYALRDNEGRFLEQTPDDMHLRLAKEYARIEAKYPNPMSEEKILGLIKGFRYVIPAGSPMFGIGNPFQLTSLSNCFVVSLMDSYGGICKADERIAQICKRRGGVGLDVSALRPKGMTTRNAACTTDGIVVFMERFSRTCREVAQSGRRGALMMTISVHHPEIVNFIRSKSDLKRVTGANISVRVTDEFMKAVKEGKEYQQRWPVDASKPEVSQMVPAAAVWKELIEHAHGFAEPGILFWDTIVRNSPADSYADQGYKTESTNPCGELPLCELDSCRLTAMNLTSYVLNPFTKSAEFNYPLFKEHVRNAQRLLDDLIDLEIECVDRILAKVESDPEPEWVKANEKALWTEVRRKCANGRRTGLGITGLGDCLAMLGLKYGGKDALEAVESIYQTLRNEAYSSSVELAQQRGAFPIFDAAKEKDNEFLKKLPKSVKDKMREHGRRNIACLTTAPVGTTSNIISMAGSGRFGVTSGFESLFRAKYTRRKKMSSDDQSKPDFVDKTGDRWKEYKISHPGLSLFEEITGKDFERSPYKGAQAEELDYVGRIEMQALATGLVDHSISNTVNMPKETTVEVVGKLCFKAWELGCKGLTIYRQGCRDGVLIASDAKNGKECEECDRAANIMTKLVTTGTRCSRIIMSMAPKRPEVLECDIQRNRVGGADWVFLVGRLHGQPYEVFGGESKHIEIPKKYKIGWILKDGKDGDRTLYDLCLGDLKDENERLVVRNIAKVFSNYSNAPFTRLVSTALRHGVPIRWVCEQITKDPEDDFFTYHKAMARVLKKYIGDGEASGLECPQCHNRGMVYRGGCPTCLVCGMSACS